MMYDVNWKVLTSLVSSSHIKCVTLWVNGMSFRSATHQRLVRSCASTWLREHHVCEKCWKSETNSLTELIVTDPDVFFPRILWKCFNNLKKKGGGERVFWPRFSICAIVTLRIRVQKQTSDLGRNRFQTSSFSACAQAEQEHFILSGRFSRSDFFPPFSPQMKHLKLKIDLSAVQTDYFSITESFHHVSAFYIQF